jgi:hypothetical protein
MEDGTPDPGALRLRSGLRERFLRQHHREIQGMQPYTPISQFPGATPPFSSRGDSERGWN